MGNMPVTVSDVSVYFWKPSVRMHSHWHEYESRYQCAGYYSKHEWVCMYSYSSHVDPVL